MSSEDRIKAFENYLGSEKEQWNTYDACYLIVHLPSSYNTKHHSLIDQGDLDLFLVEQLKPELLKEACDSAGHPFTLNMREGYDHSYHFIASFIEEHIQFHANALKK